MRRFILLVEDSADDEELMLLALAQPVDGIETCPVEVVRDGEQALNFLTAQGPYSQRSIEALPVLVLLDLNIPKVNGIELLKRIRSDRRLNPLPVVVVTTSDQPEDLHRAHLAGASSYIVKPVDFERFIATMAVLKEYWLKFNVV